MELSKWKMHQKNFKSLLSQPKMQLQIFQPEKTRCEFMARMLLGAIQE